MDKKIKLFKRLEIETFSNCNRKCVTCLRNSIPDRESTKSWFGNNELPIEDIERVLKQSIQMGFKGEVCLSHYNEPLMDDRIADIVKMTKSMGFSRVFMCSNGDYLTEELASKLDGVLDDIGISLYMDEPNLSKRRDWIRTLFKKTKLAALQAGVHMATHYSPTFDVENLIKSNRSSACHHPTVRMIVNHKGQMLLCCDDLTGHFDLGTIHDNTIEELWHSEKHQNYVLSLLKQGGRSIHEHCMTCPRQG